jgi:hypothetical protein
MSQHNFSLDVSISNKSLTESTFRPSESASSNSGPIKIRFVAVTSSSLITTKEAVPSE